jgi:hypothetical protein
MHLLRTTSFAILLAGLLFPVELQAQSPRSQSRLILDYVEQDKVYLLENLRSRITKKSEKTVVEALLAEDGPKAAKLFLMQLENYPDPALDALSRMRLNAYREALGQNNTTADLSQTSGFILQFGSFGSYDNAREMADRIGTSIPVSIFRENGLHKIRSSNTFSSRREAERAAATLPFNSFVMEQR